MLAECWDSFIDSISAFSQHRFWYNQSGGGGGHHSLSQTIFLISIRFDGALKIANFNTCLYGTVLEIYYLHIHFMQSLSEIISHRDIEWWPLINHYCLPLHLQFDKPNSSDCIPLKVYSYCCLSLHIHKAKQQ